MNEETKNLTTESAAKAHIVFFLYLLYIYVIIPLALMPLLRSVEFASVEVNGVIQVAIITLIPLLLYMLITRQKPKVVLPQAKLGFKNGLYIVIISLTAALIIRFVNMGHFNTILGEFEAVYFELPGFGALWKPLIAFGLLTATFEELWFRGPIIIEYQKRNVSAWKTALLSGLLFGIVHSGVFQVSYTLILGIIWAFMLYYTRSIWAPVLAHVVLNSLNILFNPANFLKDHNVYWDIIQGYVLVLGIVAVLMIPVAIICMRKLVINNPREKEAGKNETNLFKFGYWALVAVMISLALVFSLRLFTF